MVSYINKALKNDRIIYGIFIFFSFFLYVNSLFNGYNLDDELVTLGHRLSSKGISAIPDIFTSAYYEDTNGYSYEYRPTVLASFAIEHQLFGEYPFISHLINYLIYFATLILLYKFLICIDTSGNKVFPFLTVLLFCSFPLHTEVVSNIKNRDALLAVFFSLLSAINVFQFYKIGSFPKLLFGLLGLLLGLLSKADAMIFLFTIPLALILFFETNFKQLAIVIASFLVVSFYFIPIYSIIFKIYFYLIYLLFIATVFLFVNYNTYYSYLFNLNFRKLSSEDNISSVSKLSFLPEFSNFKIYYFLSLFVSIGISLLSFYFDFYPRIIYLFIYSLICFIIFKFYKNEWVIFCCLVYFLFVSIWFPVDNKLFEHLRFIVFFLIISYNRFGFLGFILLLISFFLMKYKLNEPIFDNNYFIIDLILVFVLYSIKFKFKRIIYAIYFVFIFIVYYINFSPTSISFLTFGIQILLTFCPILLLYLFSFHSQKIGFSYVAVSLFLIFSFSISSLDSVSLISGYSATEARKSITKITLNPVNNSYRPIGFVEDPINQNTPVNIRLGTSLFVLGSYLKKMILPYPMGFYYGYAIITPLGLGNFYVIISALIYFIIFFLGIFYLKHQKILGFSLIFFLISLFAFSNFFQLLAGVMADRFTYVASIGFCMALAFGFIYLFKISPDKNGNFSLPKNFLYLFFFIIFGYSSITIVRNSQWKNHLTLMRHDIGYLDKSAQAHNLLALNLMKYSFEKEYQNKSQAMREEALLHFKKAIEIYPEFFNAWYDLGRVYMLFNDLDKAYPCFEKVRSMDSTFILSTANMALIADAKGNTKLAENLYKEVIRINPGTQEAYGGLGYVYFKSGKLNESIKINEEAIKLFPQWTEPYQNIINIYLSQKDTVSAQRVMNQMPR